ncbi:MAG: hypothetical protein M1457_01350 [bacterium]|nr:hypothetical protein [bacterium]
MRRVIKSLLVAIVIAAAIIFVAMGGLGSLRSRFRVPRVSNPLSLLPGESPRLDPRLTALLAGAGVEVQEAKPVAGGALLYLRWPAVSADLPAGIFRQAVARGLIRSFAPAAPNTLDQRTHGGRNYYIDRYIIRF